MVPWNSLPLTPRKNITVNSFLSYRWWKSTINVDSNNDTMKEKHKHRHAKHHKQKVPETWLRGKCRLKISEKLFQNVLVPCFLCNGLLYQRRCIDVFNCRNLTLGIRIQHLSLSLSLSHLTLCMRRSNNVIKICLSFLYLILKHFFFLFQYVRTPTSSTTNCLRTSAVNYEGQNPTSTTNVLPFATDTRRNAAKHAVLWPA